MNVYYPNNVLKIPDATPSQTDAAQYMIRKGKIQYNLCGEMCVAYLMKDDTHTDTLDDYLDYWEVKDPKWYQSWFPNGISRTTSLIDLQRMLGDYGVTGTFPKLTAIPMQTNWLEGMVANSQAIVGVNIDNTGYLVGKGIPHWVVLTRFTKIDANHAIVDIYNPFTNAIEPYGWKEFLNSMGTYRQGFWLKREWTA